MKYVKKAIMLPWRKHQNLPEFLILDGPSGKILLTGHSEGHETFEETAIREIKEELGVDAITVVDLDYENTVILPQWPKTSTEHAFLLEVEDQELAYLEGPGIVEWCDLDTLKKSLIFENHRNAAKKIDLTKLT